MRRKARVTVETSLWQKALLDTAARESGSTLTDWFNSKLEEASAVYKGYHFRGGRELRDLTELRDSSEVFGALKSIDWSFTDDATAYFSHDLHPYPAKFIPQIPHFLIKQLSLHGELVWDPFGGSGTTALEAILLGRCALSTDINPIATVIGRAKTLTLIREEEDAINDFIEQLRLVGDDSHALEDILLRDRDSIAAFVPPIPNIADWFHPQAIKELAYLRWRITTWPCDKGRTLAWACFSKVVLHASFQDSETRYARKPRDVADGAIVRLFANTLSVGLGKVRNLAPLLRFREAEFKTIDLRLPAIIGCDDSATVAADSVDLIVTSPPYANATDYHLYHRFRLFWLGHDPRELAKSEIGSHLRHQKEATGFENYFEEMSASLANMARALRSGRYAIIVVGDALFAGQLYKTAEMLGAAAHRVGLEFVGIIERPVHATRRSFVAPARRAKSEHILVLRKPLRDLWVSLERPPYSLWSYEKGLRRREVAVLTGRATHGDSDENYQVLVDPLSVDKLRHLTFTHAYGSDHFHRELTWQAVLENGDTAELVSSRKDPKYVTHGIHEYKGKFYPQLAKSIFSLAKLEPGQLVLDPFCGSGTVLLEAYLNGLESVGFDLNPLAVKIARAKVGILEIDPYVCSRVLTRFRERLAQMENTSRWLSVFPESTHRELLSWFPEPAVFKLGWLRHEIQQVSDPRIREFLEVLASSIVRQVSQQDPRDLRIRRRAQPMEDAPVRELFERRLSEQHQRLVHFAERSKKAPCAFGSARVVESDSRLRAVFTSNNLSEGSVHAVVSSPPYATALPYIDTDRLSILLLFGLTSTQRSPLEDALTGSREIAGRARAALDACIDAGDFGPIASQTAKRLITEIRQKNAAEVVGFRRQNMAALLYRYFMDMTTVMTNLSPVLARDASVFFVIGDNQTEAGGQPVAVTTGRVLTETGASLGWDLADVIPITVTKENRPHSKNSITRNEILWFRKAR